MRSLSSNNKLSKRWKILIIAGVIAIGVGVAAFFYFTNTKKDSNEPGPHDYQTSAVQESQVPDKKDNSSNTPSLPEKSDTSTQSQTPTPQETPSAPPEKPTLERAGGTPTIKVVATFQQASNGYCELQFTKPGQPTITHTATIAVSASYFTCSFSIPRNSLPAGDPWNVTVIHKIGNAATASDTKVLQ